MARAASSSPALSRSDLVPASRGASRADVDDLPAVERLGAARRSLHRKGCQALLFVRRDTAMFTLGELLSRADICSRLGVAWSERAVVPAKDHSLAIIIDENDKLYINILEPEKKRLTM
jgi:hypothetical protein